MDRIQMYKDLYEKGLALIKLQRGTKIPSRGQKVGSVTERESWEELRFGKNDNAGILTGHISGIIILDIDNSELFPEEYDIPDTYIVQTLRGFHHHYRLPDDGKDYRNRSKQNDGFDIRANDGYIVAPGSSADGWTYRVINDRDLAAAPAWLLEAALIETPPGQRGLIWKTPELFDLIPAREELLQEYDSLLSSRCNKGKRSDLIWNAIGQLVTDGITNEEIISLFEAYPEGAGEKYFEKGGGRISWLNDQVNRMRAKQDELFINPFKAKKQEWVEELLQDILNTFRNEYKLTVLEEQEVALRQVCDLLISQLNHERPDWYCIPLGVSSGKTEAIKHFIRFLYRKDLERKYSICLSLEKITEIESIEKWLLEHGVPSSYFQVVHNKVPGLDNVWARLPETPVIIHTHYKLRGTSYLSRYFEYKGKQRDLLIFDESMVSSSAFADVAGSVAKELFGFLHNYETDLKLREKIPGEIYEYFKAIKERSKGLEAKLKNGDVVGPAELDLPDHYVQDYEMPELIKFANIIDSERDIFRDLLLLGKTDRSLRNIFLQKEDQGPVLFMFRETMSPSIKSLITTDASREHRTLFNFSKRPVKIYNIEDFKDYSKLEIFGVTLSGSKERIQKEFERDGQTNPYMEYIENIVRREKDNHENFLIFLSKQIKVAKSDIRYRLLSERILDANEGGRIRFETFGRENATNDYKDCGCVIFLGLHYKPRYAIKALIYGEQKGLGAIDNWMMKRVEDGELIMQLQQGSGRGTLRGNKEQVVYFCSWDASHKIKMLKKVFPSAQIEMLGAEVEEELEEEMAEVA